MKKKYKLLSKSKQALFALALTACAGTAHSQNTYTFNYSGTQQTIALQAGSYTFQTWGADGGDNLGNTSTTYFQNGGKGGYSVGMYTLTTASTVYVNVGGRGGNSTSVLNTTVAGGYNGGGYGSENTASGKSSGAGGGGASHIAMATGVLSGLSGNTSAVLIVAGGGGGAGESNYASNNTSYNSNGGFGGGTTGLQNITSGYQGRHGQGGTQSAGGGGGDNGSAVAGVPLQGIFGAGGYNNTPNGNTSAGGSGAGGGGGGWYGGGSGWVGGTSYQAGSGGGGSGYIGGVSNGTTLASGSTGFVTNPDVSGNGRVMITELCSFALMTSSSGTANPATLCSGNSMTITTNAISNYSWSTGATTNSIVVAPTTNTVYSLTALSPSNCTTTRNLAVVVSSGVPVLTLAATPASVCVGDSVKLNATGAITYTWSNGVNNNQLFPPSQTSTYVVSGKNGCGTTTAAITVTALPLPVAILSPTNTVCSGSPLSLTVTGASNYTWSTTQTASVIVVAPTGPTTYSVVGKKGNCVNTNSFAVNTNPLPNVLLAGSHTMICAGSVITLTASGGNNYTWTPSTLSGSIATDTPTASLLYQVTGSNGFGCTSLASHVVVVQPLPTITVSSPQATVCPGATVTLMATGGHTYSWNTGAQTKSLVVNPTSTTQYTVTGTHTNTGCNDEAYFTVTVSQPVVSVSASQTVCPGTAVTMTANGSNQSWSNGVSGSFNPVTVTSPTMYTVTSKVLTVHNLMCQGTGTITLGMHAQPVVVATATRSEICRNEKTVLAASGADTYMWLNNNQTGNTQTFSSGVANTYTIKVQGTDVNGCMDTSQVTVKVNACTGLAENSLSEISIYPNPSNGKFTVKSAHDVVLQVTNELGQLIRVIELNAQNQQQVNISDLPKGIYFVQGKTANETIKQKLIVE